MSKILHSEQEQTAKQAAGKAAADLVQNGMTIGLGTGSTASFFIQQLGDRCRKGLKVQAVATSARSAELALKEGISMLDINTLTSIDLTIDGADEVDDQNRLIKGGGGALLREKIVASMSTEMIVVVDDKKLVRHLGKFPLPLEILPFAFNATLFKLQKLGYKGILRKDPNGQIYLTDNGNYIYDIHFTKPLSDPEKDQRRIQEIPGVLETGFFFNLAKKVMIGFPDGHIEIRS